LIEYAEAQMALAATQADGATLRDHLIAAAKAGADPDPRLSAQPPAGTAELWQVVLALSAQRTEAVATPVSEIAAWQALHGVQLSAWEVETVQAADRACAAELRQQQAAKRKLK
jgi:hypothetical protein